MRQRERGIQFVIHAHLRVISLRAGAWMPGVPGVGEEAESPEWAEQSKGAWLVAPTTSWKQDLSLTQCPALHI
jgi:hypothetical protein